LSLQSNQQIIPFATSLLKIACDGIILPGVSCTRRARHFNSSSYLDFSRFRFLRLRQAQFQDTLLHLGIDPARINIRPQLKHPPEIRLRRHSP